MIKVKYIFYSLFWIISIQSCGAQQKVNNKSNPDTMYNFNLTKHFETFDTVRYKKLLPSEIEYLSDGTEIIMQDYESQKSYSEPPPISTLD